MNSAKNRNYGKAELKSLLMQRFFPNTTPATQTVWMSQRGLGHACRLWCRRRAKIARLLLSKMPNAKCTVSNSTAEVRHSEYGNDLLRHFAIDVRQCTGDYRTTSPIWKSQNHEQGATKSLVWSFRRGRFFCRCLQKAIGDQLTLYFIDHGLFIKAKLSK